MYNPNITLSTTTGCFIILTLLLLLDCGIGAYIGVWRNSYWSALSNKQFYPWVIHIVEFCIAALLSCWVSGFSQFVANKVSLLIRTDLTNKAFELGTYKNVEGGAQRVQEDCLSYPTLMVSLIGGIIRSIVMIVVFSVIVIYHVSVWFLLFPIIYAVVGTGIAGKIAIPLINLNYINQVLEAKFRQSMERTVYPEVYDNNYNLFVRTKFLNYFQSFYNQITIIVPHLALAGLYFSAKITFGTFMQIASSFAELINSMSYIINAFGDINKLLSCRKRLKEIQVI